MSFLDPYDIPGSSTPPQRAGHPEQTLNEELTEVIGQLGRFWGGFRKQGQTVLENARKDLGDVVTQAQRELGKLTKSDEIPTAGRETLHVATSEQEDEACVSSSPSGESSLSSSGLTERGIAPSPSHSSTLFTRLQSALPPNIVSTVQKNIPESLKHASENIDLSHLRSEFQRVQGVTRAQAEDYVHKTEALLREAVKEAGEVLKDVVKVVPPEEADSSVGVMWDGMDMWMLGVGESAEATGGAKGKGKQKQSSASAQRAVATRAEALLKRLKHDPEIIGHDMEGDGDAKAHFDDWVKTNVDSEEGGIEGQTWKARAEAALSEGVDGHALQVTHDGLVPEKLSEDDFWKRYFFRVDQIEREEQRRKALLAESLENDEDFSWEDDEDEATPPITTKMAQPFPISAAIIDGGTPVQSAQLSASGLPADSDKPSNLSSPVFLSPRQSSEEGDDSVQYVKVDASEGGKRRSNENDEDSDWE